MTVPSKINGYQVSTIEDYAFINNTTLKEVTIEEGITAIGMSAFSGCKNLAEVKLNKELQQIDSYAFSGCTALKEILFPRNESLALGDYAFSESGLAPRS